MQKYLSWEEKCHEYGDHGTSSAFNMRHEDKSVLWLHSIHHHKRRSDVKYSMRVSGCRCCLCAVTTQITNRRRLLIALDIYAKKNPAYRRQRISRPMRIVGPIQFWGPFFTVTFGVHFWLPLLRSFFDRHFWGPLLAATFGVHF